MRVYFPFLKSAYLWSRRNLFSSPLNVALTVISLWLLLETAIPFLVWAIQKATFLGTKRADCQLGGACWVFIKENFTYIMVGFYPRTELWRIYLSILIFIILIIPFFIKRFRCKVHLGFTILFGYPVIAVILLHGGVLGLSVVDTRRWSGLLLTIVLAVSGIVLASPLAILLALGRRSEFSIIRLVCTTFIEFWRGIPLIIVLFTASLMLPFFFKTDVPIDKLLRAIVGVVLFESAYLAEIVRSGLQAIPKEQQEAARVLGLGYWYTHFFIILPQALRIVVPGIMNIWIALFKDTTLVLIIGLFDLLGTVHSASNNPAWVGSAIEGYVFLALVYWVFCFSMSRYSKRFEIKIDRLRKSEN